MRPSTEDIRKRQSARQAAARERIANRNRNENTILPRRLDGSPPQPSPPQPSPRKTPPKTPPMRVRDLLKFNAKGKKWKTPEGPRIRKPIDRLTFTRKEASVPEEAVSPMSLALGGGGDVVSEHPAVGKRVARVDDGGVLCFGTIQDVFF